MAATKGKRRACDAASRKCSLGEASDREFSDEAHAVQGVEIDWNDHLFSTHHGRRCIGHAFRTARGFIVTDADERVIGVFTTRDEARSAISAAARAAPI
jgi:hypothetical protein